MKTIIILLAVLLVGCASVRQEDTSAWTGKPVSMLEIHPVFATIPVVKTRASDGTELWNFVNGANVNSCSASAGISSYGNVSGSGTTSGKTTSISGAYASTSNYAAFSSCMARFMACNNIFTIKKGIVLSYTPIGTGGARCFTNESLRPGFSGSINIR